MILMIFIIIVPSAKHTHLTCPDLADETFKTLIIKLIIKMKILHKIYYL